MLARLSGVESSSSNSIDLLGSNPTKVVCVVIPLWASASPETEIESEKVDHWRRGLIRVPDDRRESSHCERSSATAQMEMV